MISIAADWLLAYWLHGVVLATAALLLGRVAVARPATRTLLWRVALFAPLATATFAVATRGARQEVDITAPLRALVSPELGRRDVRVLLRARRGELPVRTKIVDDPFGDLVSAATVALALAAATIGGVTMARRRRRARAALAVRTPLAWEDGISLSTAPAIGSPVALRGGEICVPTPDFFALTADEQRSVLLHELAHVERRDPAWLDAARALAAMAWWQPLNRIVLSALRRDTELAADDRAIDRGARPTALVSALARFAAGMEPGAGVALADASDGDSPLVTRARRILGDVDRSARPIPAMLVVLAAVPVLMALAYAPRLTTAADLPDIGAPPVNGRKMVLMVRERAVVGVAARPLIVRGN